MPQVTLPNLRRFSDAHIKLRLKDGDVHASWDTVSVKRLFMYSERQKSFAGKCSFSVDEDDATILNVTYPAYEQQFLGVHRVVAQLELMGSAATYDARTLNIVPSTDSSDVETTEEIEVSIEVEAVDTTILYEILMACRQATDDADAAAAAADMAVQLLKGGLAGQALIKNSNEDFDFSWGNSSGIEVVQGTGQSQTAVMSQKAVTDQLGSLEDEIPSNVSDLTNDSGFQTETEVDAKVAVEAARAQEAESALSSGKVDKVTGKGLSTNDYTTPEKTKLAGLNNYDDTSIRNRATALEGQVDKIVLNGMTASEDGSTVKLSLAKINIKTGATSSVDVPLPVVSADGAGVLNPQTYNTIISNQTLINAIIGASVAVSGLAAEPTQAQVTTAWLTASGLEELVNGARLFDVTNTKVWTYYTNTELWYPVEAEGGGSVVLAQWTNSALGTVKGVADNAGHTNDGKLTAETDGTGSVLGWDRLVARVQTIESKEASWDAKAEVSDIPTSLSQLSEDSTHRLVSDTEKTTWSGKQGALSETQMAAVNSGITSAKLTALERELGDLSELETTEQSNLVEAINEVKGEADDKADKVAVASSIPAGGLLPNTLYNVGTLTGTVTINLATPTDNTIANIYHICFETGATAPTITWGSAITSWMGGSAPTINANKHYEVDVLNGVAIAMEV